eukprot:366055-Chlamydomonas_euryale.AAC.24
MESPTSEADCGWKEVWALKSPHSNRRRGVMQWQAAWQQVCAFVLQVVMQDVQTRDPPGISALCSADPKMC